MCILKFVFVVGVYGLLHLTIHILNLIFNSIIPHVQNTYGWKNLLHINACHMVPSIIKNEFPPFYMFDMQFYCIPYLQLNINLSKSNDTIIYAKNIAIRVHTFILVLYKFIFFTVDKIPQLKYPNYIIKCL